MGLRAASQPSPACNEPWCWRSPRPQIHPDACWILPKLGISLQRCSLPPAFQTKQRSSEGNRVQLAAARAKIG